MTARPRVDERGQATVELTLCLPVLALVLAVLVEVGLLVGDQLRLWHAARETARVAVVDSDPNEIRAAAEHGGLGPLDIEIEPKFSDRSTGEPLTVTLTFRSEGHLPLLGTLISSRDMTSTATMRIEQP